MSGSGGYRRKMRIRTPAGRIHHPRRYKHAPSRGSRKSAASALEILTTSPMHKPLLIVAVLGEGKRFKMCHWAFFDQSRIHPGTARTRLLTLSTPGPPV
jgi:hypothetical protein